MGFKYRGGEREFCEHYTPGETLIHTICGKCIKCCECRRIPTGKELREQADSILEGLGGLIGGLKAAAIERKDKDRDYLLEAERDK